MMYKRAQKPIVMDGVKPEVQEYLIRHQKPLSKREYDALRINIACNLSTAAMLSGLEERLRMIPGGWRDAKMLHSVFSKLFNKVLLTIPSERLKVIQSEMDYLEMYTKIEGAALYDPDERDNVVIPYKALMALAKAASDAQCAFCNKCGKAVRRCGLRKILANTFSFDLPETFGKEETCLFTDYDFSDVEQKIKECSE